MSSGSRDTISVVYLWVRHAESREEELGSTCDDVDADVFCGDADDGVRVMGRWKESLNGS